jgi:predicted metal-binding membrane protein
MQRLVTYAKNHYSLASFHCRAVFVFSKMQHDMMNIMIAYNPTLISLFIASWTAGMPAMMFPAIIPMVVHYDNLITNKQSESLAKRI